MPKRINYTLSAAERLTIEQAIKGHEDLRVRQRAQLIRLLDKGHPPEAVADLMAISVGQVYWWYNRWREEGLAGLSDKPRSGRPTVGDAAYLAKLAEVLEQEPPALGYGFNVWNARRLIAHLEQETGVKMAERTFRDLLARLGYVYRRPKHDLTPLQDQAAKERAEETLEMLKKKPKEKKSNFSLWTKQP